MKGPKGMLSEAIANALGEYFIIDPKGIEASLIKDAGLTLHHVQLRPMEGLRINDHAVAAAITGTVESVSFHWQWGSDEKLSKEQGGSGWVKNAELTIAGLKFKAVLIEQLEDEEERIAASVQAVTASTAAVQDASTVKHQKNKEPHGIKGYIQDQLNRIIDTLTLSVKEFEFSIEIPSSDSSTAASSQTPSQPLAMVFGGTAINLVSLGRHVADGAKGDPMSLLKQTLTIEKMYASVLASVLEESSTNTPSSLAPSSQNRMVPLLECFSYTASCTRFGAKRFDGGIATGLRVVGESLSEAGVVVHAGAHQLLFLNQLGGLLMAQQQQQQEQQQQQQPPAEENEKENSPKVDSSSITDAPSNENDDIHLLPSSYFELPLAALSLVLPNETKISMAADDGLMVRYQMDGHLMMIEGSSGFRVNDFPILALGEKCQWQVNVVDSKFRVFDPNTTNNNESHSSSGFVAMVHAREDEIDKIKDGANGLLDLYHDMQTQKGAIARIEAAGPTAAAVSTSEAVVAPTPSSGTPTASWSFSIEGKFGALVQGAKGETKVDCVMDQFQANLSDMTASIATIEKLYIPRSIRLQQPLLNTSLVFDGSVFHVKVGDIVAKLEEPPEDLKPENNEQPTEVNLPVSTDPHSSDHHDSVGEEPPVFVLSFGGKVAIDSVTIFKADGESKHTTVGAIYLAMGPDVASSPSTTNDTNVGETPTGGIRAALLVENLDHDMIRLGELRVSGVLHLEDLNTIHHLDVDAHQLAVTSGYSVFDWKRLFQTGDEKREAKKSIKPKGKKTDKGEPSVVIKLPHAHVHPLKVKAVVNGDVVGFKESTINIREFQGKDNTTMNDLIRFYTSAIVKNVPGLVTNASILGFDIDNATGALAGLGGAIAPVAGVLGMVGVDAIKNTIKAGKKTRDVEADDRTQFGDLFRGIGQAAKDAAQGGAKRRGKTEADKADAIDWAVGATSDVAVYTNENKSRLGGAGAGTAGFFYGMALGGPVGAVAGALISSKIASNSINVVDDRLFKKGKASAIEDQPKA